MREYAVVFYKVNVDGLFGNAEKAGEFIMTGKTPVEYKKSVWAITDRKVVGLGTERSVTCALLTRSGQALLGSIEGTPGNWHLRQDAAATFHSVPIAFFHREHTFAFPKAPRFQPSVVHSVLRSFGHQYASQMKIDPVRNDGDLRSRLKRFKMIQELTIRINRSNPDSSGDGKALDALMGKSRMASVLLRNVGDPRGLDIDDGLIAQELSMVDQGLGTVVSGRAIDQNDLEEKITPDKLATNLVANIRTVNDSTEAFARAVDSGGPIVKQYGLSFSAEVESNDGEAR